MKDKILEGLREDIKTKEDILDVDSKSLEAKELECRILRNNIEAANRLLELHRETLQNEEMPKPCSDTQYRKQ